MAFPDSVIVAGGSFFVPASTSRFGPYSIGRARYIVGFGGNPAQGGAATLRIAKSTDAGATWSPMDDAHAPTWVATSPQGMSASYDGVVTLWAAYIEPVSGTLSISSFSALTDTWGGAVAGPTIAAGGTGTQIVITAWRSADSRVALAWQSGKLAGPFFTSQFFTFNPATMSFSGLSTLARFGVAAGQAFPWGRMVEGAGGIMHITQAQAVVPNNDLTFLSIDLTNTQGGVQVIAIIDDPAAAVTVDMTYNPATGRVTLAYANFFDGAMDDDTTINVLDGASVLDVVFGNVGAVIAADSIQNTTVSLLQSTTGYAIAWHTPTQYWEDSTPTGLLLFFVTFSVPASFFLSIGLGAAALLGTFHNGGVDNLQSYAPTGIAPVAAVNIHVSAIIFPFPVMVDCCHPLVTCVIPSRDGRLYASAKTPLKLG